MNKKIIKIVVYVVVGLLILGSAGFNLYILGVNYINRISISGQQAVVAAIYKQMKETGSLTLTFDRESITMIDSTKCNTQPVVTPAPTPTPAPAE